METRCENLFIFALNGLTFMSDINNFWSSVLWTEASICALLIEEIEVRVHVLICRICFPIALIKIPEFWSVTVFSGRSDRWGAPTGKLLLPSSSQSQKLTQPCSERKTTAKITRQPFLVHLQHHAAPLSPSALLLFDIFVCCWSFLLPQSPPLMSFPFLSFSLPRAVFNCRVQPIKNKNHRV